MDKVKLSAGNLTILIAGVVILIASFLAFDKISLPSFDEGGIHIGGGTHSFSAWSSHYFLIATIPALLGVVMALHVALVAFAPQVSMPGSVLGFSWNQVHLILAGQATIMMIAFLIQDRGLDRGIGLYLMLLAAIALLIGAILRIQERGSAPPLG
ncbi:MAG TPA: hypothetical protein VL119_15060 [Acidimicrobiia bacterium]|nr:hypothetical protein [Acidimicrobiia bacterium]